MPLLLNIQRFNSSLLPACSPHCGAHNKHVQVIRQMDTEGTGLTDSHRYIRRETPTAKQEIHVVPGRSDRLKWYVTEHNAGKQRWDRMVKPMSGASQSGLL